MLYAYSIGTGALLAHADAHVESVRPVLLACSNTSDIQPGEKKKTRPWSPEMLGEPISGYGMLRLKVPQALANIDIRPAPTQCGLAGFIAAPTLNVLTSGTTMRDDESDATPHGKCNIVATSRHT